LYTAEGIINIKNAKWKADLSPIDESGICSSSMQYSKAYLRHLIHSQEYLGAMIASLHNLSFFLWLVKEARRHIIEGDFSNWKNQMVEKLQRRL
jgi:queuine tRNA-ribosyltransferase